MMFGFKNKKSVHAATTCLSSDSKSSVPPHTTERNSFEKVVTAGKKIYHSLSVTLSREPSGNTSPTKLLAAPYRLASNSSTAATSSNQTLNDCNTVSLFQDSSNSTVPTGHSLRVPDCGETFYVPGISPPPESHRNLRQTPVQRSDKLSTPRMESMTSSDTIKFVHHTEDISREPEQSCVKMGIKDRLRLRLKATCKRFILPRFLKFKNEQSSRCDSITGAGALFEINEPVEQCETVDVQSDDGDDGDDGDDDGSHPRCEFEIIEAIPKSKYHELFVASKLSTSADRVAVVRRDRGTFNAATFVEVDDDGKTGKFVVRVPGHGTLDHWTEEDAYVLEREAQLIEYIRKNTAAPIAQVVDYSTGHDNALGFPYILMTMLPGKSAYHLWFPDDYPFIDDFRALRNADVPPPHIEKKRLAFLRSLAKVMTQIQSLEFEAIGAPMFDDSGNLTGIGHTCHYKGVSDEFFKRQPVATAQEYLEGRVKAKLNQLDRCREPGDLDALNRYYGTGTLLRLIFAQPAFHGETFTIQHHDLDLQNILVDEEGNVTGIIDWDNAMTAPRCVGAAAVPMFLRSDWFPQHDFSIDVSPYMAWNHHHYREIYAAAMVEAGNVEDAKFTTKSALYQAAIAVGIEGRNAADFFPKLLHEIPHCRVDADEFLQGLGMGAWLSAIRMLETQLAKIFEPELPPVGLLEALDAELEMQTTWWSCCDGLLGPPEDYKTADDASQASLDSATGSE